MSVQYPLLVALMDDDCAALKWNAHLLAHDLRTRVVLEAESPVELLNKLRRQSRIDVVLLDVEYQPAQPALPELIAQIIAIQPAISILCLSQYGGEENLLNAIRAGAHGFLLKREVRVSIGSAVIMTRGCNFLISAGMLPLLEAKQLRAWGKVAKINNWIAHPALTPRLNEVLTLRVLYGMSAPMAASEIQLATTSIEKYMQLAYQKLSIRWGNDRLLECLEFENIHPEVWAYHVYTLPPDH